MPMVPAMQVLVFAGLVRSIAATAGYIFYAVGEPKIDTRLQIVRLSVLAALIYPFSVKWGIVGVSIVVFLSIFVSSIGFCFKAIKITKCGVKKFANTIIFPLVNGTIIVLLILGLKTIMGIGIWEFIILACAGVLAYLILTYLSDKFFNYKIQALIKESIRSFKGV